MHSARTLPAVRGGARPAAAAEGFEQAVDAHYASLVRRLTLVLGDGAEAQDVAQETYLQAFRAWPRFEGGDVRAWLYTIGLRLAFNELRRRRRALAALGRIRPRPLTDAFDPDVVAALRELEPRVRAAVLLSIVDGYTLAEIGEMLGAPTGTVASWVSRGRSRLRTALDQGHDR